MKKKRPYNLRTYLTSAIRKVFMWGPQAKEARAKALTTRGYKCAQCDGVYQRRDTDVDHLDPVVPLSGFDSWDGFIGRMFDVDNLQVLCKPCHKARTKMQLAQRVAFRKAAKALDNAS